MADQVSRPDGNTNRTLIGLTTAATPEIRNLVTDADGRLITTSSSAGTASVVSISSVAAGVVIGLSSTMNVVTAAPVGANVLVGFSSVTTATQSATTFMTIPAGRTWIGSLTASCGVRNDAGGATAAIALATISIAGSTASFPPAGNIAECDALVGASSTTSMVGTGGANSLSIPSLVVIAASSAAATLQLTTSQSGTQTRCAVSAIGLLVST